MKESPTLEITRSCGAWIDTQTNKIYTLNERFQHHMFLAENQHLLGNTPKRQSSQNFALSQGWVRVAHNYPLDVCIEGLLPAITKTWGHIGTAISANPVICVYIDVLVPNENFLVGIGNSYIFDMTNSTEQKRLERLIRKSQTII